MGQFWLIEFSLFDTRNGVLSRHIDVLGNHAEFFNRANGIDGAEAGLFG